MRYINQLGYKNIPYVTHTKDEKGKIISSVSGSGCGICTVCMMIELLTDTELAIEECVKLSENCGASHSGGTDMTVFAPVIAENFNLNYEKTSDVEKTVKHLQKGGQVIAHVCVPEGKEVGLFTKGRHYINLISFDGEDFCILDPSYTDEKFILPERLGKVNYKNAPYLYCNKNILNGEGVTNKEKYHLFSRKK